MSKEEYQLLNIVSSLDETENVIKAHEVSKYRISDLSACTKHSYRCKQYRNYSMYRCEIQVYVVDRSPNTIQITFKNSHHQY